MKICGIIAEYNPLHNGHAYQMKEAKRLSGADALLVAMSGHFVQRGEPAVFDPYQRAESAVRAGADAVFMMPPEASTASAEGFAEYGVRLLDALGCDFISCGVEAGTDIIVLKKIAKSLVNENSDVSEKIKTAMKSGMTYPAALTSAIGIDQLGPNALLALEYLKAIEKINSKMELIPVERKGAGYHETASEIRVNMDESVKHISPDDMLGMICDAVRIHDRAGELTEFLDCDDAIAARLHKSELNYSSFDEMVKDIKTKDVTYTRVARVLAHILLGIKRPAQEPKLAQLIAFIDGDLLGELKTRTMLPIASKPADFKEELASAEYVATIYNQAFWAKYHEKKTDFYRQNIIRLDKAVRTIL